MMFDIVKIAKFSGLAAHINEHSQFEFLLSELIHATLCCELIVKLIWCKAP